MPGCRKGEIIKCLKDKFNLETNTTDDPEWDHLFISDPKKNALGYELNKLINFNYSYESGNKLYDSLYALKKIYVEYLSHQGTMGKNDYDIFMKYYRLIYQQPDVIIYFYGTYENTFKRMNDTADKLKTDRHKYTNDEFNKLHFLYEWVFDNNNCRIPIFKVSVDDELPAILTNIKSILEKSEKMLD